MYQALRFLYLSFVISIFGALGAYAEATDIFKVREVLDSAGQKNSQLGILFGQPIISGELQGLGTVTALSKCSGAADDAPLCEEVAFKACVRLLPWADREDMLERTNNYNLQKYVGTMVLDTSDRIGVVTCVILKVDLRENNKFEKDKANLWAQALTDFRSYLKEEEVPVLNPDTL